MKQKNFLVFLLSLSILAFVIHLIVNLIGGYGIFRDELYYIACANHPDIGYVDHPPLSIWILSGWKFIFGESLFSIRFLPALCSGFATFIIGTLARDFGGSKYAIILAGLAFIFAPILLGFFGIFSMNSFDVVLWALVFLFAQRIFQQDKHKEWIFLGLIIGLGSLNKISMLWLGSGIFIGLLLTSNRNVLKTKTPWIAGVIAIILFTPFILWNINHDFAHLEFIRNASSDKYASQNPITFFSGLILIMNPLSAPLWVAGFWFLLSRKENWLFGYSVLTVLCVLMINVHSKPEYFASAMAILIPAGAVQFEEIFKRKYFQWIRLPYIISLTAFGIILMPIPVDVLPVETFIKYQSAIGLTPSSNEGKRLSALPQFFADRFGWKNMAEVTAGVFESLPDAEKKNCLIYGRNYGEAAAIDYFGKKYGLPPAISQHNSYWYWSKEHLNQNATIIVIGVEKEKLLKDYEDVQVAGFIYSKYAMPYENNLHVSICRKLRRPVIEVWNGRKVFI